MKYYYNHPISFEEASKSITDKAYGLGLTWLWQLPASHPFHPAAKLHDLRYDFLEPGESTYKVDNEIFESFKAIATDLDASELFVEMHVFYRILRIRGEIFEVGPNLCKLKGHNFVGCTYGQDKVYNLRCTSCGLHKELTL